MRRATLRRLALLPGFVLCLALVDASADTLVSWIGPTGSGGSGNWGTATNWSGGMVPNNGSGNTYSVTLPTYSGQYGVDLDMSPTIDSLTIDSGAQLYDDLGAQTVTTGSLTNAGFVNFVFSTMDVNGTVTNSGYFIGNHVNVTGNFTNAGGTFTPFGTVTAAQYAQTGAGSYTEIQGTMNVADGTINGGLFNVDSGSTLNGNLDVNGGSFHLYPGGTLNGDLDVHGGAFTAGSSVVSGTFTTSATSTYVESIGSILAVSGDASLAGTLDLYFSSTPPGIYEVITYLAETGEFGAVDAIGFPPYETVSLDYEPTALEVVVTRITITPEPASLLLIATGLSLLALVRRYRHRP